MMPSSELRERMKALRATDRGSGELQRMEELVELIPLQKYLEAKKRQLMAGVVTGIAMSAAVMFIVFKFVGKPPLSVVMYLSASSLLVLALIVTKQIVPKKGVNRLSPPPGSILLSVSDFFCSKKTQEVAEQVIADMRIEYNQALSEKRTMKARWIRVRYCWIFFYALALYRVLKVIADLILKPSSH